MFHLLPEAVPPEFDHSLEIYTFFNSAIAISSSNGLGSGTNGSAYVFVTISNSEK
jgi:hypothetical protein